MENFSMPGIIRRPTPIDIVSATATRRVVFTWRASCETRAIRLQRNPGSISMSLIQESNRAYSIERPSRVTRR